MRRAIQPNAALAGTFYQPWLHVVGVDLATGCDETGVVVGARGGDGIWRCRPATPEECRNAGLPPRGAGSDRRRVREQVIMVDFKKLIASLEEERKKPQYDYEYRCAKCGKDEVYVQKMPDHLLKHRPPYGRCGGLLVIRRAIPRPLTQVQMDHLEEGREVLITREGSTTSERKCVAIIDGERYATLADGARAERLLVASFKEVVVAPRKKPKAKRPNKADPERAGTTTTERWDDEAGERAWALPDDAGSK